MALTSIVVNKRNVVGAGYKVVFTATFAAGYPTGGEPITAAHRALLMPQGSGLVSDIESFYSEPNKNGTAVVTAMLDRANSKLICVSNGSEAANASDQSGSAVRCTIHYGNVSGLAA